MPTTASCSEIQSDFDEIAQLTPQPERVGPYERWLLKRISPSPGTALEVGCGVGHLARRLGRLFGKVVAIDLSEGMIAEAKRRTPEQANIEYICAELFEWLAACPERYECIVSVSTLHHVELARALQAMAAALKAGGRLLVLDLCARPGVRHAAENGAAWIVARVREVVAHRGIAPWKLRQAYWRHGRKESYLTVSAVSRIVAEILPGAAVRSHLLWRYSIVWDKPAL